MVISTKACLSLLVVIVITITWIGRIASGDKAAPNPLARGWGDSIEWVELEQGLDLAKAQKKPLMLLIHKTWCGACQMLKGKFAKAKIIAELAKNFIMVNAEDDEEPWEEEYYPDGGKYIPRILFLSPEGEVMKDIINPKDEFKQYPYYYSNPAPIIQVMQKVMQRFGSGGSKLTEAMDEATGKKEDTSKDGDKKEKDEKPVEQEKPKDEQRKDDIQEKKEKADLPRKAKAAKDPAESAPGEQMEDVPKPPSHLPPKIDL